MMQKRFLKKKSGGALDVFELRFLFTAPIGVTVVEYAVRL
jgi:hypothetical protein